MMVCIQLALERFKLGSSEVQMPRFMNSELSARNVEPTRLILNLNCPVPPAKRRHFRDLLF